MSLKEFLDSGYKFAFSQLEDNGTIAPFGIGAKSGEKPTAFFPDDGLPETVRDKLFADLSSGRFEAVAMFCEVDVDDDPNVKKAIAVYLDNIYGTSQLVLTPFDIRNEKPQYGQPTILDNPEPYQPPNNSAL